MKIIHSMHLFLICAALSISTAEASDFDVVRLTKELLASLTSKNKVDKWPRLGPLKKWDLEIDTYTHDLPSSAIADLYNEACSKLAELYGNEVTTYTWKDGEGYPRIETIVQLKNGSHRSSYLIVCAYSNNDNDMFLFAYLAGNFNGRGKLRQSTWNLPKGLLRSDSE